jgi:hypothetical protein
MIELILLQQADVDIRVVTPTQATVASSLVLLAAVWPMLTLWQWGYPSSWIVEFLFLLCATMSIFSAPALFAAILIDIIRRRSGREVSPGEPEIVAVILHSPGPLRRSVKSGANGLPEPIACCFRYFDSFEAYCRLKWQDSRRYVDQPENST